MNVVILSGNLTRDPEAKVINSNGKQSTVTHFTLASSRRYTKKDGTKDEETYFASCEVWDSGAELIAQSLSKGDKLLVEGSMKTDSWEKDGEKRSRDKVRVSKFEFLSPKKTSTDAKPQNPQAETVGAGAGVENTDIPF